MHLRPEASQQPTNRDIYARLGARLLLDGVMDADGSRMLRRRLPNGHTARLYDYWSFALKAYAEQYETHGTQIYDSLLRHEDSVLVCDITSSDPENNPAYNKPVFAYKPHRINPEVANGALLHSMAAAVEEADVVIASLDIRRHLELPLLHADRHDIIKQFI